MGAYLVLLVIAALGVALGWRLTPGPYEGPAPQGLARLVQLGVALTGILGLAVLLLPVVLSLPDAACTPEIEQTGACMVGLHERALFGAAAFVCAIGSAFAFLLRKGILDFPESPPPGPSEDEAPPPKPEPEPEVAAVEAEADAPKADAPKADAPEADAPKAEPKAEPKADAPETDESLSEPTTPPDDRPAGHRKLEGPVYRAFVDDHTVELEEAIQTAIERLSTGGKRIAVVFSRGASKDANVALDELAKAFDAYRYVLEGTAAATEGVPSGEAPNPSEADEIAGPGARHAGELALDLAGALIETVMLLDTRVAFPEFVLGRLTEVQSVCIAHAHDDVSAACQVVLPGTNPGEKEGEVVDADGIVSARMPRAWLVERMLEVLRAQTEPAKPAEPEPAKPADESL